MSSVLRLEAIILVLLLIVLIQVIMLANVKTWWVDSAIATISVRQYRVYKGGEGVFWVEGVLKP